MNYCIDCDNVHTATRELDPWKWCCVKAPVEPGFGYVHPTYSPSPPYENCARIRRNVGAICEMFEPRREAEPPPIMNRSTRHAS